MRAELLKIRSMPTPRWTAAALVVFLLGGLIATIIWGPGEENLVLDTAIGLPTSVASLVFGSWIAGVEFGQNTLRRVFGADPRRVRMVLVKLAVLLLCVAGATVLLTALGALLYSLASSGHDRTIEFDGALRGAAAIGVFNLAWAVTAFSLTLMTRSMAGGTIISFAFLFVIDGLTSVIPTVGDYSLGIVLADIDLAIRGESEGIFAVTATNDTAVAAVVLAGWLAAFLAAGAIRTKSSEVK